jgi:hypothetical protein
MRLSALAPVLALCACATANRAATPAAPATAPVAVSTPGELGELVMGYYRAPWPERLVDVLAAGDRLGVVGEHTMGPFAAFAGAVLRDHPELLRDGARRMAAASPAGQILWWRSVWMAGTPAALIALATAEARSAEVRQALEVMRAQPAPDPLLVPIASPGQLDELWSSFFATGDPRYVVRVASALELLEEADPRTKVIGEAARWSLRSNAESHPRVREALEAAAAADGQGADPARVRALLADTSPIVPPGR